MTRSWDDLKKGLLHECFRRSVAEVAREIHCHRSSLYRLISGFHKHPTGPLLDHIDKLVESGDSRTRQPRDIQSR